MISWSLSKFEPISSREWHRKPYAESCITIRPQIAKLWPKMVSPWWQKKTILKSDGTIETALKKEVYPENFRILSQKTPKRVTFRRPYLRKLFPFLNLIFKSELQNTIFKKIWKFLNLIIKSDLLNTIFKKNV